MSKNTPASICTDGGHRLFVRDWGTGRPVVLLAGWGTDSRLWAESMIGLNAAGLRTVSYDRRGHGLSSDPGRYDYDALADDLARVLETLDLRDVTLVTHSGAVGEAVRYATRYGLERISRMVWVAATGPHVLQTADDAEGFVSPAMLEAQLERLSYDVGRWIDENIEPFAPGAPKRVLDWLSQMVLNTSRRGLIDFQRAIAEADFRSDAMKLELPITLIHGDRDVSAPIEACAYRWLALLPDAELVRYDGVAHGVMVTHGKRLATDIARCVERRE
ncbi:MAG: hypothetical protein JWN04_1990 [Myxococcaceae bacterium]|nr:hypothetical protein [Myxococcaceae bacterium]